MTRGLMKIEEKDPQKIKDLWRDVFSKEFKSEPADIEMIRCDGLIRYLQLKSKDTTKNILPVLEKFVIDNIGSNTTNQDIETKIKQHNAFYGIDSAFQFEYSNLRSEF